MDLRLIDVTSLTAGVTATKMSALASLTFLLYDYVLTFEAEKEFVWNRRWSLGKVLFIFNRYFGLFSLAFNTIVFFSGSLRNEFCKSFILWETASQIMAVTSVVLILQARIYAVYDRNRMVLCAMIVLSIAAIVSAATLIHVGIPEGFALDVLGLTGCYVTVPRILFVCWLPALISETIMCLLMLYKAVLAYRQDSSCTTLQLIIRDSWLYFVTIFAVLLGNCLIWSVGPQATAEAALGWMIAIPCAVGSRLLINMRERLYQKQLPTSLLLSDMAFAQGEA